MEEGILGQRLISRLALTEQGRMEVDIKKRQRTEQYLEEKMGQTW